MVVPLDQIYLAEDLLSCQPLCKIVDEWQEVRVGNFGAVQATVITTGVQGRILLGHCVEA